MTIGMFGTAGQAGIDAAQKGASLEDQRRAARIAAVTYVSVKGMMGKAGPDTPNAATKSVTDTITDALSDFAAATLGTVFADQIVFGTKGKPDSTEGG